MRKLRFQDVRQVSLQEVELLPGMIVPRVGEKVHLVNQRYEVSEVVHDYYDGFFRGVFVTLTEP
jgi:hypothetical protein